MNCEQCTDTFGDAVDGALSPERQAQVDAHCRECASCRDLLSDLMSIRAAAATLDRHTPSPAVWTAIEARLAPTRTYAATWAPLAAAAGLLIMLGIAAWFGIGPTWRQGEEGATAELARAASELQLAEQHYLNAIASLEQLTANNANALDPGVAVEIAQSLQSIDRAITDSRAALKSEPGSFVAQTSLLEALRMKVALLQETVSLMNARS